MTITRIRDFPEVIQNVRSKISSIPESFRNESEARRAIQNAKEALTDLTLIVEKLAQKVLTDK